MSHRRLFTLAAIFAAVIVAGFVLSVPHAREVPSGSAGSASAVAVPQVTLHDAYKKGVRTLSGTVTAPDACATVAAEASLTGDASSSPGILLALIIPPDAGTCLLLPTEIPFSAMLEAPAEAEVTVTVNGAEASTTPA
jgi:hypothetical protein